MYGESVPYNLRWLCQKPLDSTSVSNPFFMKFFDGKENFYFTNFGLHELNVNLLRGDAFESKNSEIDKYKQRFGYKTLEPLTKYNNEVLLTNFCINVAKRIAREYQAQVTNLSKTVRNSQIEDYLLLAFGINRKNAYKTIYPAEFAQILNQNLRLNLTNDEIGLLQFLILKQDLNVPGFSYKTLIEFVIINMGKPLQNKITLGDKITLEHISGVDKNSIPNYLEQIMKYCSSYGKKSL